MRDSDGHVRRHWRGGIGAVGWASGRAATAVGDGGFRRLVVPAPPAAAAERGRSRADRTLAQPRDVHHPPLRPRERMERTTLLQRRIQTVVGLLRATGRTRASRLAGCAPLRRARSTVTCSLCAMRCWCLPCLLIVAAHAAQARVCRCYHARGPAPRCCRNSAARCTCNGRATAVQRSCSGYVTVV